MQTLIMVILNSGILVNKIYIDIIDI